MTNTKTTEVVGIYEIAYNDNIKEWEMFLIWNGKRAFMKRSVFKTALIVTANHLNGK